MTAHRILVKAPNWVGDCVMATPAIALLRDAFPNAQIDVLSRSGVSPVFSANPYVSNLITGDERKDARAILRELKEARYEAAALLPNSLGSAWLALRAGIPRRVGFARGGRRILLTRPLAYRAGEWQTRTPQPLSKKSMCGPHDAAPQPRHMVFYYLEVARALAAELGVAKDLPATPHLQWFLDAEAGQALTERLERDGLMDARFIGINPGAAYGGAKRWPLEYLARVADELAAKHGALIVSTASIKESALNDELQRHVGAKILRLGEELNLHGLAQLIARMKLLITNDSGAMHMAAALGTPTVAVFGPTDWNVTSPWSDRAVVVRQSPQCAPCFLRECPIDHLCMRDVTPEMVMSGSAAILGRE